MSETPMTETPERHAEAMPSEAPTLYDADARQRIPVTLLIDDERFDVGLIAEPLHDGTLAGYALAVEAANAAESAEDEDARPALFSRTLGAVGQLFDAAISDIEGFEEGEEKPDDWRDIFDPQEKAAVVDRAFFGIEVIPPPPAKKGKRPKWGAGLRSATTRLRVPFNGRPVEVSHTLAKPDAARLGEFTSLYTRSLGMARGGDANMQVYAAGYDELHVAHAGYKGRPPMHHRAVAYVAHMIRQGAVVRKN